MVLWSCPRKCSDNMSNGEDGSDFPSDFLNLPSFSFRYTGAFLCCAQSLLLSCAFHLWFVHTVAGMCVHILGKHPYLLQFHVSQESLKCPWYRMISQSKVHMNKIFFWSHFHLVKHILIANLNRLIKTLGFFFSKWGYFYFHFISFNNSVWFFSLMYFHIWHFMSHSQ